MKAPIWGLHATGYFASKTALNMFTVKLAKELLNEGIKVNAACPGSVVTDMGGPMAPRTVEQGAVIAIRLASPRWVGWDQQAGFSMMERVQAWLLTGGKTTREQESFQTWHHVVQRGALADVNASVSSNDTCAALSLVGTQRGIESQDQTAPGPSSQFIQFAQVGQHLGADRVRSPLAERQSIQCLEKMPRIILQVSGACIDRVGYAMEVPFLGTGLSGWMAWRQR
ncbi:SDR family NAD(P)-dependent oxidoreductase [Dyella sp.]|uniref:SDR family NAD(P)-dependent oxidoreductase n=1 Tax=Dyella sp. TaxID=1869338 RepID=UPI002ED5D26B